MGSSNNNTEYKMTFKERPNETGKEKGDKIKIINVKIKSKKGLWEKEYNIETQLNQIESDFKKENNINNDFIEFTMNNSKIAMNSRLLESIIIEEDQNEIILEQKINEDEITNLENYIKQIDFISRPMSNPFEIYIFEIEKKLIKRLKYTKEKVQMFELDKYGENSAFCNGMNHLFISGGIDPITNEEINLFWDIDIENNCLKNKIKMPISKKNHNMIFFNETVYIVGGEEENTIFYDTEKMAFIEWENLNQKKFKPSLIICDSILFCFDSSLKYSSKLNIEKINISETIPKWEIINPEINSDIKQIIYSQKFFGLIQDKNENIIFFVGQYENNDINPDFNLIMQYNIKDNLIEKNEEVKLIGIDDIKDIQLDEKSFLSVDNNTYIIFPSFTRRAPKILYYYKDKNCLELKLYHSNPHLTKLTKFNTDKKINIKEKPLNGFSMKKSLNKNKNNDINIIQNNFIGKKISVNDDYNNKNKNNKNKSTILENDKNKKIKIKDKNSDADKISKNSEINNNNNDKKSHESNIENSKEKININNKEEEVKKDISINKINEIKNKEDNQKTKKEDSENSRRSSIKEISSNKSKEKEEEKDGEKSEEKEKDDKDDETNKTDKKEELPTEINNDENSDDNKIKKVKTITQSTNPIINNKTTYFHSSVNHIPMNNFEKLENNRAVKNNIRMKNIFQPKVISNKSLKLAMNHFNRSNIKDMEEFNNY